MLNFRNFTFYHKFNFIPKFAKVFVFMFVFFACQNKKLNASLAPAFSDNLDLTGGLVLSGDMIIGSKAVIIQGLGTINGQSNTIFLDGDLVIPANNYIRFTSDTIIDGQGHDIIFEDEAYFKIDGVAGTTLTLRNCKVKGVKDYSSGNASIMFGTSSLQKLSLNDVIFYLEDDFSFDGGGLDITNEVKIKGFENVFAYYSSDDITINKDSRLFLDIKLAFLYAPVDKRGRHIVMASNSSELFMNGCIFAQGEQCGLLLTIGHLIIDHKVLVFNSGQQKKSLAMCFGDNSDDSNLNIDIMPSASISIVYGGLIYDNIDEIRI